MESLVTDLLHILAELEGIARNSNSLRFHQQIERIKNIYERLGQRLPAAETFREAHRRLAGYASRLDDLTTQLNAGAQDLGQDYAGPASERHAHTTSEAIQRLNTLQQRLRSAAYFHDLLANHYAEAAMQQTMLARQAGEIMRLCGAFLPWPWGMDAELLAGAIDADVKAAEQTMDRMDLAIQHTEAIIAAMSDPTN